MSHIRKENISLFLDEGGRGGGGRERGERPQGSSTQAQLKQAGRARSFTTRDVVKDFTARDMVKVFNTQNLVKVFNKTIFGEKLKKSYIKNHIREKKSEEKFFLD